MAARDFIISFFAQTPQLNAELAKLHTEPLIWAPSVPVPAGRRTGDYHGFVASMGNSIQGIFDQVKKSPSDTLGRVCVMGFSEGGQGVDAILGCSDAAGVDTVINCDGIHTNYVGQTDLSKTPALKTINPANLYRYIAFASLALQAPPDQAGARMMILTHSSVTPTYASTTETMGVIWTEATKHASGYQDAMCGYDCPAAVFESDLASIVWPNAQYPLGTKLPAATITDAGWTTVRPQAPETNNLPPATFSWSGFADGWAIRRMANGLFVFGWVYPTPGKTKDPTGNRDHVFQAQMVLPHVAAEMLVKRWNGSCSPSSTQGFGQSSCTMGGGVTFDPGAGALPDPYAGLTVPSLPTNCPVPPPGRFIVGAPGDPCALDGAAPASAGVGSYLLAAAAGGLGFWGARWAIRKWL